MPSRSEPRRATIDDVADAAGVSRAAVSKVLRDAYGVSKAMRERVNQAIADLNYRPQISARVMRGSAYTVGVVIPHFGSYFISDIVEGVTAHLRDTPYQVIVAPADDEHRIGHRALEALYDRQVDGIIAIAPLAKPDWLEALAVKVPLVQLGRHDVSQRYDTIAGDDAAGARLVMAHLLGEGHQRIAHLAHVDPGTSRLRTTPQAIRRAVYQSAMREAGLSEHIQVITARYEEEPARRAMHAALDRGDAPTAVFAGNDDAALGVLRAIAERGLTTADIAVAGYDDARLASHPNISLTSVNQDGHQMGQRAAALLLERVDGRDEAVHETHEARLIVRTSSTRDAAGLTSGAPTPR
ncbi:LacI family transcriptional regulator [Actinoplanes sp. TBRC 11911]|uniref:LacI family DNA-binding transcriptional regulator n=1 Tax=Actinoplanes sp. TBRC 11911 TaxID=2729386 RepID=UPI00145F2B2C|nr:LacI family DNA-binding transcriptional regulator [Actinoplanes sp. TBRC 11911]NMO56838.1 LacI family transcriptional regulator [Actinoplanes sp. TBRC 11911]